MASRSSSVAMSFSESEGFEHTTAAITSGVAIMNKRLTFRLFWGERRESAAECTQRVYKTVQKLSKFDRSYGEWWTGSKDATKGDKVPSDAENIERFLLNNARDIRAPEEMREELGFSTIMWSEDGTSSMSFSCGGYNFGPYGPFNSFILKTQIGQRKERISLFRCLVDIWEPWQGSIWNRHIRSELSQPPVGVPEVGWVTYLRTKTKVVDDLPDDISRIDAPHGVILIVGDGPPERGDEEMIDKLNTLQCKIRESDIVAEVSLLSSL